MRKFILSALLSLASLGVFAQDVATSTSSYSITSVMLIIMALLMVFVLSLVLYLSYAVGQLQSHVKGMPALGFWAMLFSLKPIEEDSKLEIVDHDFDGIKELSNPIPPWFNVLFYGTIIIGILYFVAYHIIDFAPLQDEEYRKEMAIAEVQKNEFLRKIGNSIDENSVTILTDEASLDAGKQEYISKCAACHGQSGEGGVGPNLTDKYWLHGGSVNNVFKIIKYGVPAKGMIAWQSSLNPLKMQHVTSYILSLQGTNPVGGKEPQGELYEPDAPASAIK
jgi:cytochrome c oxidase cbb3-type subunit 3